MLFNNALCIVPRRMVLFNHALRHGFYLTTVHCATTLLSAMHCVTTLSIDHSVIHYTMTSIVRPRIARHDIYALGVEHHR
jgi:hypothetical protein